LCCILAADDRVLLGTLVWHVRHDQVSFGDERAQIEAPVGEGRGPFLGDSPGTCRIAWDIAAADVQDGALAWRAPRVMPAVSSGATVANHDHKRKRLAADPLGARARYLVEQRSGGVACWTC